MDASWDERLISALEEVLFLLDAHGQIPMTVSVTSAGADAVAVSFRLASISDIELIGSTPKGIARSGLKFSPKVDGWQCEVIVDV